MPETTIYLSVIRGDESLTLDGSLHLLSELVMTLNNSAKETPTIIPDPPAPTPPAGDQATPTENKENDTCQQP